LLKAYTEQETSRSSLKV